MNIGHAAVSVVTHDEMTLGRFDQIFRLRDGRLANEAIVGPHFETTTLQLAPTRGHCRRETDYDRASPSWVIANYCNTRA
jgi:hypothetical protein